MGRVGRLAQRLCDSSGYTDSLHSTLIHSHLSSLGSALGIAPPPSILSLLCPSFFTVGTQFPGWPIVSAGLNPDAKSPNLTFVHNDQPGVAS